jgi:peptidoglycan/LPS O-acetylase OafA/YrhL
LILSIVRVPTFARRFQYKTLRFLGDNAYCTYLTHLPVLGLMHGFILGAKPGLQSPAQWAVTVAALPVSLIVGWGMTRLIEVPLTRYGRHWRWGDTYASGAPATTSSRAAALSSSPKS